MRCDCCNRNLSDYESTLKSLMTGEFLNTCMRCLQDTGIEFIGNSKNSNDLVDEDDEDFDWDVMESEDD